MSGSGFTGKTFGISGIENKTAFTDPPPKLGAVSTGAKIGKGSSKKANMPHHKSSVKP